MYNLVGQEQFSGNRCGHRPNEPRWYERSVNAKPTYDVIHLSLEALKFFYFAPHNYLTRLDEMRESSRQVRSDRREAITAVAQVLVDHMDVATGEVIWLKTPERKGDTAADIKDFVDSLEKTRIPLTLTMLASKAGLSLSRCERAISDLKEAKYLEVERQFIINKTTGEIIPKPAKKRLTLAFFLHLGISLEKYKRCVNEAKKRLKSLTKKDLIALREAKAAVELITDQFKHLSNRGLKRKKGTLKPINEKNITNTQNSPWSDEKRAHYTELIKRLRQNMPNSSEIEIKDLANKMIRNWK